MCFGRFRFLSAMGLACCLGFLISNTSAQAFQPFRLTSTTLAQGCQSGCSIAGVVTYKSSPTRFVYSTWGVHGQVTVINASGLVYPRGSVLHVGQTVRVAGSFDSSGFLEATNVTVFTLRHIATVANDDYRGGGAYASAAQVNALVSYAATGGKGLVDCHSTLLGCKAIYYMRPFALRAATPASCLIHPDAGILSGAQESWFVHNTGYTDAAHRVYGYDRWGCKLFGMNPNSTGLQAAWNKHLQSNANAYDLFFVDMSPMDLKNATWYSSGGGCTPWPHVCLSTQELPSDLAVTSAHVNFVNALRYTNGNPMYFLYQQAYPAWSLSFDMFAINSTGRYFGVSCEGCLADVPPAPPVSPANYAPFLDEMAAVNKTGGEFLIISKGEYPAGSANQILQRSVTVGVAWLAYSEGHTMVQPDLERNTLNLAVWPEDMIYPASPLETMVSGSVDLEVAPGVYRREFQHCYQNSQTFGSCAAIVNANGYAVAIQPAWLRLTYHHVVVLTGGDVLSGGKANLAGSSFIAGITLVPAGGATLLAP